MQTSNEHISIDQQLIGHDQPCYVIAEMSANHGQSLSKAKELSEKSLSLEPDNSSYLDTYGWILFKLGDLDGALKYVKMSLEKSPNSSEVLEHLGDILYSKGEKKEALTYWKKAQEQGNDDKKLADKIIKEMQK